MPPSPPLPPPYGDILKPLVKSIMRAQADLVSAAIAKRPVETLEPRVLNRHFSWLGIVTKRPANRHLYDGFGQTFPLRTKALQRTRRLPADIRRVLTARKSLPLPQAGRKSPYIVEEGPTRIVSLILAAHRDCLSFNATLRDTFTLRSPLAIALDYLTAPEMPGSKAYVQLGLRNLLFETFELFPESIGGRKQKTFSVQDLEDAFSHVWTSFRPRHFSKGEDRLPESRSQPVDRLFRNYLAAKNFFWFSFRSARQCLAYCRGELFEGGPKGRPKIEFIRSPYLEGLPEVGELTNELFGLPIPLRGADTLFRGGLRFSSDGGLVVAIHGGPGAGKTTLALSIGAHLAPFHIITLFITADGNVSGLRDRAQGLVPHESRRLSFYPKKSEDWLDIQPTTGEPSRDEPEGVLSDLKSALATFARRLRENSAIEVATVTPTVCRAIVVLDGLHDLFFRAAASSDSAAKAEMLSELRSFVSLCRDLKALVILTTGENWEGDAALDYLVDVALRLTNDSVADYGQKPDRRIRVLKARYQLCATGTHGFQISGLKGVRFSPQINYQLDRKAAWKMRLPALTSEKPVFARLFQFSDIRRQLVEQIRFRSNHVLHTKKDGVSIFQGSNIFINGRGSGGKAGLALKIALSPSFIEGDFSRPVPGEARQNVLIVSFLYPPEYYAEIYEILRHRRRIELGAATTAPRSRHHVIHLYPGYLKPNDLFNRIEWELDAAELRGDPYTTVIVDGIHNVFLQFPALEEYTLFWPQLYSTLRTRPVTIITTHTTLSVPHAVDDLRYEVDDRRSEPLRHALVQKTDFQFEIDRVLIRSKSNKEFSGIYATFAVTTLSAINQPIPSQPIYWSRERLVLFEAPDMELVPGLSSQTQNTSQPINQQVSSVRSISPKVVRDSLSKNLR